MAMDPVSFLQLYCNQNNYRLDFTSISELKAPGTMFTFRCDMENLNAIGSAVSKKRAKQVSARNMICMLIDKQMFEYNDMNRANDVLEADLAKEAKEEASKASHGEGGEPENNPVSRLSELCVKKHWGLASYQDIGEIGLPHERVFKVSCTVPNLNHTTYGEAGNKKAARRAAAQAMMEYLRAENFDTVDEVLDRLPGPSKNANTGCFIEALKRSKTEKYPFGKVTYLQKVDKICQELANDDEFLDCLLRLTGFDVVKYVDQDIERRSVEELETILSELAAVGKFDYKKHFTREENYFCNVTIEKDDVILFSWYGKAEGKDEASHIAFMFVLKAFITEIYILGRKMINLKLKH